MIDVEIFRGEWLNAFVGNTAFYKTLKTVELKDTYQYLFKTIFIIVNLKYDSLTLFLNNLNKNLESLREVYFLLLCLFLKLIALLTV